VLGPAAEERDELRAEVGRLETEIAETRESCAVELRGVVEERDSLTAELEEARELLRQAERVRESQIALEAERDRAVAELERLQTVAADAQAELEEQTRLLAEEQDRHYAERESLLTQRTVLEQELGSAIEQLAAAATAADEREEQLQLGSQRLLEALNVVRRLAAELSGGAELVDEPEPVGAEMDTESEVEAASDQSETEAAEVASEPDEPGHETEEIDYSLFVPGPNGYELVPQTGLPPQAGQKVELILPDRDEPIAYEVVRSGRTLPGGDVCVYLAQV
jgi:fused signal recognition particle receptor